MSHHVPPGAALLLAALVHVASATAAETPFFRMAPSAGMATDATSLTLGIPASVSLGRTFLGDVITGRIAARNASGPVTFELTGGSLPDGVSLAPDGTLSGTLRTLGSTTFRVRATDAGKRSGELSVPVTVEVPTAALADLPGTLRSMIPSTAVLTTNLPDGTWEVASVPADLALSRNGSFLTVTAPTVLSPTTYEVRLRVARPSGAFATATATFTALPPPQFTQQPADATFNLGSAVNIPSVLAYAADPVTYRLLKDGFPASDALDGCGLVFSPASSAITGSADALCSVSGLAVEARDATGATLETRTFSLAVRSYLAMASEPAPSYVVPRGGSKAIAAAFQGRPSGKVTWTLAATDGGSVPDWLSASLDACQGTLSCTLQASPDPSAPATSPRGFVIRATDAAGASAQTREFLVSIGDPFVTVDSANPTLTEGNTYLMQARTNLDDPSWSLIGAPAGTAIDARGVISIYGYDVSARTTLQPFKVQASSNGLAATLPNVVATIEPALVSYSNLGPLHAGAPFAYALSVNLPAGGTWSMGGAAIAEQGKATARAAGTAQAATGGTYVDVALPISYAMPAGSAPDGVTPAVANGSAVMRVYPAVSVTGSLQASYVLKEGESFPSAQLGYAAGSMIGSAKWSMPGAPAGLSVSAAGLVSGAPGVGTAGTYTVTPTVSDTGDASPYGSAGRSFTLTVSASSILSVPTTTLQVASVQLPTTTGDCTTLKVTNVGSAPATAPMLAVTGGEFQSCQPTSGACTGSTSLAKDASCYVGVRISTSSAGGKSGSAQISAGGGASPVPLVLSGSATAAPVVTAAQIRPNYYSVNGSPYNVQSPMYGLDGSSGNGYVTLQSSGQYVQAVYAQDVQAGCARIVGADPGLSGGFQVEALDASGNVVSTSATFYPNVGGRVIYIAGWSQTSARSFRLVLRSPNTNRIREFRPGAGSSGNCNYP